MIDRNALISAISQALGPAFTPPLIPVGQSSRARRARITITGHLYEQYIWTLVLEAARKENATITYWDVTGSQLTQNSPIIFRAGPGYIYSRKKAYTHALIEFPNRPPLEAHVGVRVAASSNVMHECDVVVLTWEEAATCRNENAIPRASQVILGIECKLHGTEIPLGEGRGFVGLTADLGNAKKRFYFVSNVRYSLSSGITPPSAIKLLKARGQSWESSIFPSVPSVPFTGEEQRLINAFQKVFINATW